MCLSCMGWKIVWSETPFLTKSFNALQFYSFRSTIFLVILVKLRRKLRLQMLTSTERNAHEQDVKMIPVHLRPGYSGLPLMPITSKIKSWRLSRFYRWQWKMIIKVWLTSFHSKDFPLFPGFLIYHVISLSDYTFKNRRSCASQTLAWSGEMG